LKFKTFTFFRSKKLFTHEDLKKNKLYEYYLNFESAILYIGMGIISLFCFFNIETFIPELLEYKKYFLIPTLLGIYGIISFSINFTKYIKLKNKIV